MPSAPKRLTDDERAARRAALPSNEELNRPKPGPDPLGGQAPFQLMNIRPSPTERWSDDPNFQGARFQPNPSGKGEHLQMYIDPEKHIERTSRYEGSTDRRHPGTGERQSTADVWVDKKRESKVSRSSKDPHTGKPFHGSGIVESLQRGEKIRNPVRLLLNRNRFPLAGNQPVQGEGHHRVAGSALEQQAARERGGADWGRPVPFTLHTDPQEAKKADRFGSRIAKASLAVAGLRSRALTFKAATGSR